MNSSVLEKIRILVLDDEDDTLNAFSKILAPDHSPTSNRAQMDKLEAKLFPQEGSRRFPEGYDLTLCRQAEEALAAVSRAQEENRPFAVAFLDVRLPPGPDGVWAAERIRRLDPWVQLVIVTAYSDVHPEDIALRVPPPERLLYLQKPFHQMEIQHFAAALSAKWRTEKLLEQARLDLENQVEQRTKDLDQLNRRLQEDIAERKKSQEVLQEKEKELSRHTENLAEMNTAMKVLLNHLEQEKVEQEEDILANLEKLVFPYLEKVGQGHLDENQRTFLEIVTTNLRNLTSKFARRLSSLKNKLTPGELQVADLLKQGKTSKEIADLLNLSLTTISFHRRNIRRKLELTNRGVNLKAYLQSQK
ncbi:MAG: LuxR C-terminal-related transcriptional regulator [Desulfarculaceae bacterium]|jgi:DNA-binding NarL/FixJ family response regulator